MGLGVVREATAPVVRWFRSCFAGLVIALSTLMFIYLAIYAYVISYPILGRGDPDGEHLSRVVALIGGRGAYFFFLTVTILVAYWATRRIDAKAVAHGIVVGLAAAIIFQLIVFILYPPVETDELVMYLAFGALGGYVGGFEGGRASAGRRALYRVSRRISEATDPQAVVDAIGEDLGGPSVRGVVLCRANPSGEDDGQGVPFEVQASWVPGNGESWPTRTDLVRGAIPDLHLIAQRRSMWLGPRNLSPAERNVWEIRRIGRALVVPLAKGDGAPAGMLVVTFARGGFLYRTGAGEFLTVGAQAAVALENMRLMERNRRATLLAERRRLSHEIHDTLAQGFASISATLAAIELSSPQTFEEDPRIRRYFEEARRTARENLAEVRRLVQALRPELLDRWPLHEALRRFVRAWSSETGVEARVSVSGDVRPLVLETEVVLFRVLQESLNNVRKHARADTVTVVLSFREARVTLSVADDGSGFDVVRRPEDGEDGFGLRSMRERAGAAGGSFSIVSKPGAGTRLRITLPFRPEDSSIMEVDPDDLTEDRRRG